MIDNQEANLSAEQVVDKLDDTKAPESISENATAGVEIETSESSNVEEKTDAAQEDNVNSISKLSKEEILEKLRSLVYNSADVSRSDFESLKQVYYKICRTESDAAKEAFLQAGGAEEDFKQTEDPTDETFKELVSVYKEKRAAAAAEEEKEKANNYAIKLKLIEQLKALCESSDDFNKLYAEFKEIQQRWKEVKAVPQEYVNELWKNYQTYSEQFYDIIKINNQFRDYDFKKNLEMKTALCENVEKLADEPDTISAFHQLQKMHQQWREIGPVSKEYREELWSRFKKASTVINKRHQEYFDNLKARENENLAEKTKICEELESIDFSTMKTFKDWEAKNQEVMDLQAKWKTIGFAPKKYNVKIFERFRQACDVYFAKKTQFYKDIKEEMEKNLELKRSLCEKAEALKDSTDWKSATEKFIALQKEWKTVGNVARKHSDAVWKRFIAACDYFFEQKAKHVSSHRSEEHANLVAKKSIIEKIKGLTDADNVTETLKELMAEWNRVGHVPFKDKDKLYKAYREAVDAVFDKLKIDRNELKMQSFKDNLGDMSEKGKNKLYNERDKLVRLYERMKNELQTYENNIGFLSISSKGGGGLLKELERKIEKLKEEMELTIKKIDAIDENLE